MMSEQRRESSYLMVPVTEAHRLIVAHIAPLPAETISSLSADGRVLAEDIFATENTPDVAKAMVDGYALRAADGMQERRVVAEVTAGLADDLYVEPGTAVRIMTGAPVPPGADTVVMVEYTTEKAGMLRIEQPVSQGTHIQLAGQDIQEGQQILTRGTVLGAADIGLLATVGQTRILVYQQPRVAVLATGDEVVEPDAPRRAGSVRDSNRYALLAAIREAGGQGISLGIARDTLEEQRTAIQVGLAQADMLITSGGVSMGTRDLIKPLLATLGTIHFGRVAFKPGKPTLFATVNDPERGALPVFGLPGFPVSSLVSFEVFVRPTLRRLQGDAHPERPNVRVTLLDAIRPARDRPEYQRVVITWQDGRLVAHSTGGQSSNRLLSLRGANGLLIVPPRERSYEAGEALEALVTGPLKCETRSLRYNIPLPEN